MARPYFSTSSNKIVQLMKVALGEAEADIAIVNGDLVNVYTGELLKNHTVLIKGNTIAYAGEKAPSAAIRSNTRVIRAEGKTIIPGFLDSHTHVDDKYFPDKLVSYAIRGNTATIITETAAIGSLLGYRGVLEFMKACRRQPVRFFFTVPPVVCVSPSAEKHCALSQLELKRLLREKDVLGLGEVSWAQVNENHARLLETIATTLNSGKHVDGHAAGARERKLQAFFAAGVSSCHEPTNAEEVLERLRMGIFVPIREGEVRKDLAETAKIRDFQIDKKLLGISADGVDPRQLVNDGYMDFVVQKAINHGIDPIIAIQMATVNPASHFGLNFIGGIAPGKLADIAIIPDLTHIKAEIVIINGKIVMQDDKVTAKPRKTVFPGSFYQSIKLDHEFTGSDFDINIPNRNPVKIRVIDMVSDLVAREAILEVAAKQGILVTDLDEDILKVAAIDRYWNPGKFAVGFIRGFGLKKGAIATSTAWDCAYIMVVGVNNADMARAVNRIKETQGGTVVCADNEVIAELPLPVAGLFSDKSMEFIAGKYDDIQHAAQKFGTKLPDIHMSLQVLATPSIPFLRICEEGLFDLKQNKFVSLIAE
jgi:adenine deaminase